MATTARNKGHETVEHTADMGLRGWGATPAEALEETACALLDLMADRGGLEGELRFEFDVTGDGPEELLVEFLNELLSLSDVEEAVLTGVTVKWCVDEGDGWALRAVVNGVPRTEFRDRMLREVKAAASYGASITRVGGGQWTALCVVDL
ncbi:MAG: archease [Candidatus Krumholzibacteria bacterium]|nr:archease [Candidatus Krumholzibacteria bacterium]